MSAAENNRPMGMGPGPGGPGARAARGGFQKPKNAGKTLRRLLPYLTARKSLLAVVFACVLISSGSAIAGGYRLRPIINTYLVGGLTDLRGFALAILGLGGIYLAGALATWLQNKIMVNLAQHGANRLRKDLFDHLQTLPLSYFDAHTHGELMSRFTNDADNVQMAMQQSVVSLISSSLLFGGIVAMMLFLSPPLFLVSAAVLGLTALAFKVTGGRSRLYYRRQQQALGALNGNIQEMIDGLKVVKAFGHEEEAKRDFDALNGDYRAAATEAGFYSTAIMPISNNLMNIGYALTAMFGGLLSALSGFDLGGLVVYLTYSKQVGQPINMISQQVTTILSALAGAERIFEVMDRQSETDEGAVTLVPVDGDGRESETRTGRWAWKRGEELIPLRGAVRLTDVHFGYVPGTEVLKGVSVYANPGQKIAFVGSTGAGKTTITNLINRFYDISEGVITYDGIDVREIKKESLRRSLGSVLQDTHLFTGTVMGNIRYGRLDATDEECIAAAKSAGAHSFIRRLPEGYETKITGDGANLSQGQRQLLAIARAAVADPPVMILDEATSSIDTRTERLIERGMDALMKDRTVFVIAHRLSTVRNANAIIVVEGGEIIERGDHADLLAQEGRYWQLYTGQHQLA